MEEKFIIYKQDDGGVMILWPTEDCLKSHTIEEIAKKEKTIVPTQISPMYGTFVDKGPYCAEYGQDL